MHFTEFWTRFCCTLLFPFPWNLNLVRFFFSLFRLLPFFLYFSLFVNAILMSVFLNSCNFPFKSNKDKMSNHCLFNSMSSHTIQAFEKSKCIPNDNSLRRIQVQFRKFIWIFDWNPKHFPYWKNVAASLQFMKEFLRYWTNCTGTLRFLVRISNLSFCFWINWKKEKSNIVPMVKM